MKNRAKCKLCQSVIESFHRNDYVSCKCGEIAITGGLDQLLTHARDYFNFLRVDDEGNEILVKYKEKDEAEKANEYPADVNKELTKEELIKELETMIQSDEKLPEQAHLQPLNYYDLLRYMLLISNILKKG